MIDSLILIEGTKVNKEVLRSVSLMNAKQIVMGRAPGLGSIVHIAANSHTDLENALLAFEQVSGVTKVSTLLLRP